MEKESTQVKIDVLSDIVNNNSLLKPVEIQKQQEEIDNNFKKIQTKDLNNDNIFDEKDVKIAFLQFYLFYIIISKMQKGEDK